MNSVLSDRIKIFCQSPSVRIRCSFTHTHTHTYIYIYIYTHTHTHTHIYTHTEDHSHKSFNGDSREAGNHMTVKETEVSAMSTFPNTTTVKKNSPA